MNLSRGFTIFEVLISIFILISSIYVLTNLHLRTLFRIVKDRENLERIYLLKKEAYLIFLSPPQDDKPQKIDIEKPDFVIISEIVEIDKNSPFFSMNERLNMIKTVGHWIRNDNKLVLSMPFFVKKEKNEENKEKDKS